jgi:hypothetical protein
LHSTKWSNGKKKGWKLFSSKKRKKKDNSIQDSVRNEEKGYPVPDLNKTMINVTKEPNDMHKNLQGRNFGRYHQEIHGDDTRYG